MRYRYLGMQAVDVQHYLMNQTSFERRGQRGGVTKLLHVRSHRNTESNLPSSPYLSSFFDVEAAAELCQYSNSNEEGGRYVRYAVSSERKRCLSGLTPQAMRSRDVYVEADTSVAE